MTVIIQTKEDRTWISEEKCPLGPLPRGHICHGYQQGRGWVDECVDCRKTVLHLWEIHWKAGKYDQ